MKGFQLISSREAIPFRPPIITIYSEPGVGKTTLSTTMPGGVLLLDADDGALRAHKKRRHAQIVKIDEYGAFWDFFMSDEMFSFVSESEIHSLAIDTIGTFLDNKVAPWLIREDPKCGTSLGGLSLAGWGSLATHFKAFKNRCDDLQLKLLFLAHGKEEDIRGVKQARLDIKGSTSQFVMSVSDMLGYMYTKGNRTILDFNKSDFFFSKNTAGLAPIQIEHAESDAFAATLERVYDACVTEMQKHSDEQIAFLSELDIIRSQLGECSTSTDFEDFIAALATKPTLMQKQIKKELLARLQETAMKYDKKTGKVFKTEGHDV